MLVLATVLDTHAIIVPEGAAIAMGVWVLGIPGWIVSRPGVALLVPVCALIGVLVERSDLPTWVAVSAAAVAALLVLHACDSRLVPALSAAVLPVVFDVRAWSYPLAVLVICAVVAAAMPWLVPPRVTGSRHATGRYPGSIVGAGAAIITAWAIVAGELAGLSAAVLAPPLLVSALEWLGQQDARRAHAGLRRCALLVGAALAGSVAVPIIPVAWIAGCLAVAVTVGLMRVLATWHPPALAIALIPLILASPARDPLDFTLAIATGAGVLYLATYAVAAAIAARGRVPST